MPITRLGPLEKTERAGDTIKTKVDALLEQCEKRLEDNKKKHDEKQTKNLITR